MSRIRFQRRLLAAIGLILPLGGCTATVGASGGVSVPHDAGNSCAEHCASIGMSLDSVVIMANNVGCVCRPTRGGGKTGSRDGASSGGGMAAIVVAQQQQQAQQARR